MKENIQLVLSNYESKYSDLSVFLDKEEAEFYVYIGVALLERVSIDAEEIGHKMFIGRLYNSGVKLSVLKERFEHDPRTIKKWGRALKTCDVDEMSKAFTGRKAKMKTTPELIRYVVQQYKERFILGHSFREKIIMRVEEVFGVRLSPSLISGIYRNCGDDLPDDSFDLEDENKATLEHEETFTGSKYVGSVQRSPFFSSDRPLSPNGEMIHHAGLVLFEKHLSSYPWFQRQIICQILSGAVNVEQSKSLCFESLAKFCPKSLKTLREQRQLLDDYATLDGELELYRINAGLLSDGPGKGKVYYFDPHTKRYTGTLNTLKGWCGSLHSVSRIINLDCFHTQSGRPCFIQHYSPYYDMRERFFMSLAVFDELFAPDDRSGRTFVIDRGIFGLECFKRFENDYLITWEKGFDGDGWDEDAETLAFTRYKLKNGKSAKKKKYSFECQESPWSRMSGIRRIIVKATNHNGDTITVSVLCSNPFMPIEDVVWLIFNRWLQENDFKYLDAHFGINQLDSRARDDFKNRMDQFKDREVDSSEYKELKKESKSASEALGRNLLKQNRKQKEIETKQMDIDRLEAALAILPGEDLKKELTKESRKAENSLKRMNKRLGELRAEQRSIEERLEKAEDKQTASLRKQSRVKQLVDGNYQLIDTRRKAYMDALRINAANIFRNVSDEFRIIYDNLRDDHHHLRTLSRSNGIITRSHSQLTVSLWLPGTLQNHIVKAMEKLTCKLTEQINSDTGMRTELKIKLVTGIISSW